MKTILLSIFLVLSIDAFSQEIDSTKLKTSLSLQARDWVYLNSFIKNTQQFENVYDTFKVKLRATAKPAATTVIKVDSIRQGQILALARIIKESPYSIVSFVYTRINNALRSNAYLIRKLDEMDANYSAQYDARILAEYDDLRAVLLQ